jgi:hypothetical protein
MFDVLEPNLTDLVTAALAAGREPRPDRSTFLYPTPGVRYRSTRPSCWHVPSVSWAAGARPLWVGRPAQVVESEGAAERGMA